MYTGLAMLFATTLTVPAGTLQADPASADLVLARGIIHQVDISFLDGPENEVHVIVRRPGLHQLVPTSDGDVVGNAQTVSAYLREEILEAPFHLVVDAWSPNATYAHEVAVRVHILPPEVIQPPQEGLGILQKLKSAILGGP